MERSELELQRFSTLEELREHGFDYPNDVYLTGCSSDISGAEIVEPEKANRITVAGRMVQNRLMGKAAFAHLLDARGKFQIYLKRDDLGEQSYERFKNLDIGDLVEVSGYVFKTKTGENTLYTESIRLLSKCLVPLPEKWHGLTDVEARYRQRYIDLIANPEARQIFYSRAKILSYIRSFLDGRGYLEVETPVLTQAAGGAEARPFLTHYNALHTDMALRIALELPLKKLVVGGLERVYELGRVFRNEGISKKHNPEFSMLEFYEAYSDIDRMMQLTEELFVGLATEIVGGLKVPFGERELDFTPPWPRISMVDSIKEIGGVAGDKDLYDLDTVVSVAKESGVHLDEPKDWGRSIEALWGDLVEPKIINPVFITHHPFSISPLARKNRERPEVVDRFELIICGMEMANAFSELNDPIDQRERFEEQARRRAAGDQEAPEIEEDFLRALEYGMPPTGGEGIGIDRLVMVLTNSPTIRDVLLFPQLKPLNPSEPQEK